MKKLTYLFFVVTLAFVSMGADCDSGPPPPPATGFSIHTQNSIDGIMVGRTIVDFGNVDTAGNVINDIGTAYGNTRGFRAFTDARGFFKVNDGRVPARWHFAEFTGPCRGKSVNDDVTAHKEQLLLCVLPDLPFGFFTATPSSVDLMSPPASFTLSGQGIDTTYGMPLVEYYSDSGVLVAQTTATAVAGDGTWLQANTPNLSSVYSGTYLIAVRNATWEGLYEFVGTTSVDTWGRDYVGCDPDGSQEQYCWNSGGDWDPYSCTCQANPCYINNASPGGNNQQMMEQPMCY
jgi:hypothetical protein